MSMSTRPPEPRSGADVVAWFRVADELDLFVARNGLRHIAQGLGFEARAIHELVIVVSELCSNILKYAVRGWIRYSTYMHPRHGLSLCIEAGDRGRPFRDFEMARLDGCDDDGPVDPVLIAKRRGTATGLGAVQRFSNELLYKPTSDGKIIEVTRYLHPP